jgi:hypothetical protein
MAIPARRQWSDGQSRTAKEGEGEKAMASRKRISIATSLGLLSGIICYVLGRYWLGIDIIMAGFFTILAHRTLLGFHRQKSQHVYIREVVPSR